MEVDRIQTGKKGYIFISHLYRSSPKLPSYSPFISEKQAKKTGII